MAQKDGASLYQLTIFFVTSDKCYMYCGFQEVDAIRLTDYCRVLTYTT